MQSDITVSTTTVHFVKDTDWEIFDPKTNFAFWYGRKEQWRPVVVGWQYPGPDQCSNGNSMDDDGDCETNFWNVCGVLMWKNKCSNLISLYHSCIDLRCQTTTDDKIVFNNQPLILVTNVIMTYNDIWPCPIIADRPTTLISLWQLSRLPYINIGMVYKTPLLSGSLNKENNRAVDTWANMLI